MSATAFALSVMVAALAAQQAPAGGGQRGGGGQQPAAPPMRLMTQAFVDGGLIPVKFTQAGTQTSPALAWTNAPQTTQSFVLVVQ